jgi:hypothetical protein
MSVNPRLALQRGNPPELFQIVRDKSTSLNDGLSRDEHVYPADGRALPLKIPSDFSVDNGGLQIERRDFKGEEKCFQGSTVLFPGGAFFRAVVQFSGGNGGYRNVSGRMPLKVLTHARRLVF